jgi:chromosome segregation ATPase
MRENETKLNSLAHKLIVAESKKRFTEQVERDVNNMTWEVVIPPEIKQLKEDLSLKTQTIRQLEDEVANKTAAMEKMNMVLETAQHQLVTSERNSARLEAKLEEITRKESHIQERIAEAVRTSELTVQNLERECDKERAVTRTQQDRIEALSREKSELELQLKKMEASKATAESNAIDALKVISIFFTNVA